MEARVVLYSRKGCHLCEEVRAQLDSLQVEHRFTLVEVDIDHDAALREQYDHHVPVVTIDGVEALRHRWSPKCFREALRRRD